MALVAVLLASCGKTEPARMVDCGFVASIEPEIIVRSGESGAAALCADHAVLEVRLPEGGLAARQELAIEPGTSSVTFANVGLAAGFDYDVFIWVDCDGRYTTSDLRKVSFASAGTYIGGSAEYDAFCSYSTIHSTAEPGAYAVTLRRPFAQINLNVPAGAASARVAFTAATALDLKTGSVCGSADFSYELAIGAEGGTAGDFVFAEDETAEMLYHYTLDSEETHTVTIPYRRNTKTTINIVN